MHDAGKRTRPARGWAAIALALALLALVPAPATASTAVRARSLESAVLERINELRAERGLAPLRLAPGLTQAAAAHAQAMGRRGFFSHTSADGTSFAERVLRYYPRGGFARWAAGENLAWIDPRLTAGDVVSMWLGSPPHRRNLLDPAWRELGVAAVRVDAAPGVFEGRDTTIVVADFGVRAR
jgi:uncharacterized protein YkwD